MTTKTKRKKTKKKSVVLTKAELIKKLLQDDPQLSKEIAVNLVELFFEKISEALCHGEEVKLTNFGNFHVRDKKQRVGRNPKTGEEVSISARRVVTFHPSKNLKSKIKN